MSAPAATGAPSVATLVDRWATVDGLRLFSRISENGEAGTPPIVHVHGFAISGRYLEPTAVRLASRYPTFVPDLPGHGHSEKPPRPLAIPELAASLASYLDAMAVPRAVLLGNSSGCLVAAELAHRSPERVERLVLVSPAGGPHNRPLLRGLMQLTRDGFREPAALARIAIPDYLRFGPVNAVRAFRAMTRYPTARRLVHLPVACLVVVGVRDPLVSTRRLDIVVRSAGKIDDVCRIDAAHAINFSQPDTLARIVDAYLRDEPLADVQADGLIVGDVTVLES